MKLLLCLALCASFVIRLEALDCSEVAQEECNETEYKTYVECIRKRMKRSIECDNPVEEVCPNCEACRQCDCDYCSVNTCQQSCNSCCPNNPPCNTNRCCHRTCHARCKSSTCRTECRKTCTDKITTTVAADGGSKNTTTGTKSHHNITTVINLHNLINNTNVIDIPIQVNNTNVNNITLGGSEDTLTETINGSSIQIPKETCCHVVSPRQCVPSEKYPYVRCFHLRRKMCGPFCNAPIIHEQPREICDQTAFGTTCHQQLIYIPQPQPRCAYQPSWPYVSCGAQQQQQQQQFCGGCYSHYNSPYPQMPPPGCSPGCYDDGYGMGPYYRQGPFYRPGYAHVPSCYQLGSCGYGGGGYWDSFGGGYVGGFPGGCYGGGCGYPVQDFGGFGGFPGVGYPPTSYENNVHIETDPANVPPKPTMRTKNLNGAKVEVEEPPPPSYFNVPMVPPYSAVGYPYAPQPYAPPYLPREVDIQATITHPEKNTRYAQITISNDPSKREDSEGEEQKSETTTENAEAST